MEGNTPSPSEMPTVRKPRRHDSTSTGVHVGRPTSPRAWSSSTTSVYNHGASADQGRALGSFASSRIEALPGASSLSSSSPALTSRKPAALGAASADHTSGCRGAGASGLHCAGPCSEALTR